MDEDTSRVLRSSHARDLHFSYHPHTTTTTIIIIIMTLQGITPYHSDWKLDLLFLIDQYVATLPVDPSYLVAYSYSIVLISLSFEDPFIFLLACLLALLFELPRSLPASVCWAAYFQTVLLSTVAVNCSLLFITSSTNFPYYSQWLHKTLYCPPTSNR